MIASVALSCDTSFGCDLLDKMLGRAGCSSCQAPKAPSCGCGGGGLMDKIIGKSAGCGCGGSDMLTYDASMDCGPVASSCGCDSAPAADCGCSAPASPCGGGGGCGLFSKARGGLGSLGGGGCGCDAPAPVADCGCSAPAPAPVAVADCGCSAPAPVADCGCSTPAPAPVAVADCGCSAPAPVADCGCSAPAAPASPCGGGGGLGLFSKVRGSVGGGDCGCSAPAPAPAPVADCGCGSPALGGQCGLGKKMSLGLFSKFQKSGCGSPAPVSDCGCSAPAPAPAPVVADCGCSAPAAPASPCGGGVGSGLFSNVRGSFGGGDCGCSAPAAAPAPPCGGGCGGGGGLGLFSKVRGGGGDCGCSAPAPAPAPVVSTCGCNAPVSGGCGSTNEACGVRGKLTLLDRLRGNRIPRTKEGVVIGSCNDGCNPPCPHQPTPAPAGDCGCGAPVEAAPCTSCGEREITYGDTQPYDSGCSTCQGSTEGDIIYGDSGALAAPVIIDGDGESNVAPVVPDANTTEGVIESGGGSGTKGVEDAVDAVKEAVEGASPVVDPGAFVPARRTTVGS